MGMAMALPALKVGGGLIGSWLGSKLNKNPVKGGQVEQPSEQSYARTPEASSSYAKLTGAGDQAMQEGSQLTGPVNNYYRSLLSGNRSAMQGATAPERTSINATYQGAEEGAKRMKGPAKDRALAKLNLQKAGQVGTLPYIARRDAAKAAGDLGNQQTAVAGGLYSRALDSSDNLQQMRLNDIRQKENLGLEGARVNLANVENQRKSGEGFGSMFYDIINGIGKPKGAGSVNGLPITPFKPSIMPNRP